MEHWQPLQSRARRDEILLAIEEHDNGWREPDARPSIDASSGRIRDFVHESIGVRQGVWPRGVARLLAHPRAAALVAQHALTVYERFRIDAEWAGFFTEMTQTRDRILAGLPTSLDELVADYAFVRIGDLISLIFCNEWNETQHFAGFTFARAGDSVLIEPNPFNEREIPIEVPAVELADRRFTTDAELREAIAAAALVTLPGKIAGRT